MVFLGKDSVGVATDNILSGTTVSTEGPDQNGPGRFINQI